LRPAREAALTAVKNDDTRTLDPLRDVEAMTARSFPDLDVEGHAIRLGSYGRR
jgi:hypothetical protein